MDYTTLTDAQLTAELHAVLAERERRQAVADVPAQIEELSRRYYNASGKELPPVAAAQAGVAKGKAER